MGENIELESDVKDKSEEQLEDTSRETANNSKVTEIMEQNNPLYNNVIHFEESVDNEIGFVIETNIVEKSMNHSDGKYEGGGSSEQNPRLMEQEQTADNVLREIHQTDRNDSDNQKKGLFWTRFKFISWSIGLSISSTTLTIGILNYIRGGEKAPGLTDEQKARIKQLIEQWNQLPDNLFWDSMSAYVQNIKPSFDAQILFMVYAKDLCLTKSAWNSTVSKSDCVDQLYNTYFEKRDSSMIYQTVKNMRYSPSDLEAIPRYQAIDLCLLALTNIRHDLSLKPEERNHTHG